MTTKCPFCHKKFMVDSDFLGKRVKCSNPVCKKGFVVEEYSSNVPVYNSGNNYKGDSDDVLSPPVNSPRISETPFKNPDFVNPVSQRVRTQRSSYEGVPSYWALKTISILLDIVGTIILISPFFFYPSTLKTKNPAITNLENHIVALEQEKQNPGNKNSIDEIDNLITKAKEDLKTVKDIENVGNKTQDLIIGSIIFGCIIIGIIIIAAAQLLAAVRDMARNSF